MSQEELRKTGPVESDVDSVVSALFDIEDLERAAASWEDGVGIRAALSVAASALDDLSKALGAWFERHPE